MAERPGYKASSKEVRQNLPDLNPSDGFLGAKGDHLWRELPWRVPSQGELYESMVENLPWNRQGESRTMYGERVHTPFCVILFHPTVRCTCPILSKKIVTQFDRHGNL